MIRAGVDPLYSALVITNYFEGGSCGGIFGSCSLDSWLAAADLIIAAEELSQLAFVHSSNTTKFEEQGARMPAADSRFDTSSWKAKDLEAEGSSSSSQASGSGSEGSQHIPEDDLGEGSEEGLIDEEDEKLVGEGAEDDEGNAIMAPLSQKELASFESKQRKRGIIYIGRIPPGMTPPKVRHLLSGFGEVERIYLQDGRKKAREAEEGSAGKNTKSCRYWQACCRCFRAAASLVLDK